MTKLSRHFKTELLLAPSHLPPKKMGRTGPANLPIPSAQARCWKPPSMDFFISLPWSLRAHASGSPAFFQEVLTLRHLGHSGNSCVRLQLLGSVQKGQGTLLSVLLLGKLASHQLTFKCKRALSTVHFHDSLEGTRSWWLFSTDNLNISNVLGSMARRFSSFGRCHPLSLRYQGHDPHDY